jgi:hypothetical protein
MITGHVTHHRGSRRSNSPAEAGSASNLGLRAPSSSPSVESLQFDTSKEIPPTLTSCIRVGISVKLILRDLVKLLNATTPWWSRGHHARGSPIRAITCDTYGLILAGTWLSSSEKPT